jgi:uncharacterized membrane protein YbaN (DUF454 family)
LKQILIASGIICLVLGIIGIFLPLLPTTPLLLLAAFCFARSSDRIYRWLLNHRVLGRYIKCYLETGGVTRKTKISAIALVWLSIGLTVVFLMPTAFGRILLLIIAAAVTVYIASLPRARI